ncbi:MAG: hypothetical protein DI539_09905 [Flavobacterium psychrophilum]|nr:MAG: hypothetical protein DI539_09905 [Flavobacterium psychrophilum]
MKNKIKGEKAMRAGKVPEVRPPGAIVTYKSDFLDAMTVIRQPIKCIYLHSEQHARLKRIVQVIGNDAIPLSAYLTNIVEHHFRIFDDAIKKEYEQSYKTSI